MTAEKNTKHAKLIQAYCDRREIGEIVDPVVEALRAELIECKHAAAETRQRNALDFLCDEVVAFMVAEIERRHAYQGAIRDSELPGVMSIIERYAAEYADCLNPGNTHTNHVRPLFTAIEQRIRGIGIHITSGERNIATIATLNATNVKNI